MDETMLCDARGNIRTFWESEESALPNEPTEPVAFSVRNPPPHKPAALIPPLGVDPLLVPTDDTSEPSALGPLFTSLRISPVGPEGEGLPYLRGQWS